MTQFDESTENMVDRISWPDLKIMYRKGRENAKESLVILARALIEADAQYADDLARFNLIRQAVADVKRRGDWPLEEER